MRTPLRGDERVGSCSSDSARFAQLPRFLSFGGSYFEVESNTIQNKSNRGGSRVDHPMKFADAQLEVLLAEEEEIERATIVSTAAPEPPSVYDAWTDYVRVLRRHETYSHLHPVIQAACSANMFEAKSLTFGRFHRSYTHFVRQWESNANARMQIVRNYVLRPKTWQYPLTNPRWF